MCQVWSVIKAMPVVVSHKHIVTIMVSHKGSAKCGQPSVVRHKHIVPIVVSHKHTVLSVFRHKGSAKCGQS